jgi:hypothetical protein
MYDLGREVIWRTSGLVEVLTTEPQLASTFGTTIADVLPHRGGPRTRTPCSGALKRASSFLIPRYMPYPCRSARARRRACSEVYTKPVCPKRFPVYLPVIVHSYSDRS